MNWLLLTILAILARGTMSIATKLLTNRIKVSSLTQTTIFMGLGAVLTFCVSPFVGGISFAGLSHQLIGVGAIILVQCTANIIFFKAQAELEAGVTQIAFASILLWSTLLSIIFLHTHFSAKQFIGIIILLAAIILAQYSKGVKRLNPAVTLVIISAAMYAAFQIISAGLSKHLSTAAYLITAYAGTTIVLAAIQPKRLIKEVASLKPKGGSAFLTVLFASSMSVAYFTFSYLAYKHAPVQGTVAVLLTSQVVVAVLLGMIFLKERQNKERKLGAALVALLAGILIKS